MIANPQATTHEPTRCPVKFNRPKYAGRVCLMKRPVFRSLKSRRMAARRGFRLGHDGLPLAFGSLCARLAAFHFEIKAKMNADDPCESPAERPSCPSEPRTLPNKDKTKHSRRGQREDRGEHPPERDSSSPTPPPRISQWRRGTLHRSAQAYASPRR